jgi:hypothetical protein
VPADRIMVPGLSEDEQATLDRLVEQLDAKTHRNLLRASYYDGKRALRQVGTVIPPQYYRLGIVLGWSAKAVDILARRCNLDGFVWPGGDLGSIGGPEVWEDNHLGSEVSSGLISSLIHGVSFLVATKGGPGEPPALLHAKDPLNATGEWNGRTRRLDNLLSVTGRDDKGKPTSFALYLPNLTIICDRGSAGWEITDRQEHPWGMTAEALVYKPRVGRHFGTSRISRAVMSLHDQALRTVIRMEGHMDVYSFPQLWLLGADEAIFKNADGTMKAGWQLMLGRVLGIPDNDDAPVGQERADVKQFSAQDPDPHIKALKQQAMLFSGETSIPLTSLGVSDMSNPTSADSYIASREDLIAEAEGATDDWGPPLRRSYQRALAMANGLTEIPAEFRTIDAKWRSPVYVSRAAAADAGAKQLASMPWLAETEVGLELLGLDEQQIRRAMANRRRLAGRAVLEAIGADT